MRIIIQKCANGSVKSGDYYQEIQKGYVIFVGFTEGDNISSIEYLARKVANLRIFEDENGVMNKSIKEENGEILSISQFTLYADTKNGNRPSYKEALKSEEAKILYDKWNLELSKYVPVKTGIFASHMLIHIDNIGPTTIIMEK